MACNNCSIILKN